MLKYICFVREHNRSFIRNYHLCSILPDCFLFFPSSMFSFFHLFIDSTQTHAITHSHTHDRVIQSHTRPDGRTQNDDDDDDDDQSQVNKEFDKSFKRFVISSFFGIWSTQLKLSELKPNENVPTSSEQSHSLYTINEWTHKMCCDSVCNGFCEWIDSHNLIDWNRERANTSLTPQESV